MFDSDFISVATKGNESFYIEDGEFILITAVIVDLRKRSIYMLLAGDAGEINWEFTDFSNSSEFMELHNLIKEGVWEGVVFYTDPSGFIDWRETAEV